jgi:hypothetical protein
VKETEWEVDVKIRRNGRLYRRECAMGSTPMAAFDNATNDLIRDLQQADGPS